MWVAVVFFSSSDSSALGSYAKEIAKGIESQGHRVEIIDAVRDQVAKLSMYQYIVIGTEQTSLFGKIDGKIAARLPSMGALQGKKAFAFVSKKLFGEQRVLLRLMKILEKEGLLIRFSEVILSKAHAYEVGKRLRIDN